MAYWVRWEGSDGEEGARVLGPFTSRREASAALIEQARRASADLEFGTGKAGSYDVSRDRQTATLWCDDMFHDDAPLGSYVIEQDPPETT